MKRVDIVDVKADIRDGELALDINNCGEILLRDTKTTEAVKIGEIEMKKSIQFFSPDWAYSEE